ncbi:MAG: aminomethyl transferase family protein, partial [Acidobacteria bacterium]|nr:aminomethyl transferase family protein [Acidobacteriota bacterium]
ELWQELIAMGERFSLRPVGWEAYQVLRVEAGIPLFGTDMDESHMPLEAGLEHALSTTKGCYVGQEVMARILYRGHVNRKLTGLRLQGGKVPEKGSTIVAGDKEIGQVTSAVFSPALGQPIALGYVRREFLTPGSKVEVKFNGDSASAEVVTLPFYRRP